MEQSQLFFPAHVIRKLIDGQDVESYLSLLPPAWKEIGRNVSACPNSPTLRSQAFEASIAHLPNGMEIRKAVFAADLKADLHQHQDLADQIPVPPLPAACLVPIQPGDNACFWLDMYNCFSKDWSPRGYDGFHESCGLWVLSTSAAGRVVVHLGKPRFTSLYIALVARTSSFSKSTTAGIALAVLKSAGMSHLLMPDNATPQKFLTEMKAVLPEDYAGLDDLGQIYARMKIAFAGQRAWFYDEFGQGIAAMMRREGPMTEFRGLMRRLDDTPERYECGTIGRGSDVIEHPYLSLLVSMTPADIAPFAQRGSSLWGDGFLARFALVTPPTGAKRRGRFPKGERVIPNELIAPLQAWHKRLGIPEVELKVEKVTGKDGKATSMERAHVKPVKPVILELADEVFEAFYAYDEGLNEICSKNTIEDLDGNYGRFSEKALRIAALFASMSQSPQVKLAHWAKAQAVTERWRAGLHNLHHQINTPHITEEVINEDRILKIIQKLKGASAREIHQYTKLPARQIQSMLDGLIQSELIVKETNGRMTRYHFIDEVEP